jgi:N-acetylmuramoyl-L-alanine amidase/putative methionine-R-sulfoxide reductase with GAF domain
MPTQPSNKNPGRVRKTPTPSDPALRDGGHPAAAPPDQREVLQALLAFSTLHDQIRRRRAEQTRRYDQGLSPAADAWEFEQFVLDEVLQLVAERAQAITGADGVAIALAQGDEIVCRASSGAMAPDRGVQLDSRAGFSGACFRSGRIIRCDDSEKDPRVNREACRQLGTRSMVAVPLLSQANVVGLLEAFSTRPFAFKDSDVRNLNLLAELIQGALKPEEEDRIVRAAKVAAADLEFAELESQGTLPSRQFFPKTSTEPKAVEAPLELSQESIAPWIDSSWLEGSQPGLVIALLVALLVILVAGPLWWLHRERDLQGQAANVTAVEPASPGLSAQQAENAASSASGAASPVAENSPGRVPGSALVTGIRQFSSAGSSTVVVDLEEQVQYEPHRLRSPSRIYFDLLNTSLAPGLNGRVLDPQDGLIGRIRLAQPAGNLTRVELDTKPGVTCSVGLEENPYRLVIEVRAADQTLPPKVVPSPVEPAQDFSQMPPAPASPLPPEEAQGRNHLAKLRIVIDAGHGGWDLGTVGRGGLVEKNLVLEVAERLGGLLQGRLGSEVIFTRKDDNYVPLEQRAELANQAQADLFISVHANYSDLASARGVETYYSSFFSPPQTRDVELHENAKASAVNHPKLSAVELKEKVDESRKLAASVQRALYGTLAAHNTGIRNRGVREASYMVLTGTEMPSILAEISFVSSPDDEQRLQSTEYRQQIAEALCKGIEQFAAARHVKIASTASRQNSSTPASQP